jgi:hypothetical protein
MNESTTTDDNKKYVPGDVVETAFGVGVITHCPDPHDDDPDRSTVTYRVMLWRIPGKSIGSSSRAHLQANLVSESTWCLLDHGSGDVIQTLLFASCPFALLLLFLSLYLVLSDFVVVDFNFNSDFRTLAGRTWNDHNEK